MDKNIEVLFLDDEENILNSLKRLFRNAPYAIWTTSNPHEALKILKDQDIKVVLSDYRMPEMTGVDFLEKAKAIKPEAVRVLFTGYADFSAAERAINIGEVYRFISKPWDGEELKATVGFALERYNLLAENQRLFKEMAQKNVELERLNRRLKNMYESQKEFTSTVSHELRTPLASMKSTLELVLSETAGPLNADQKKFLNKTKNNVDRLNRLINDILDLTKMESGKMDFQICFHSIARVIQETVEAHEQIARQKGLILQTVLPDQDPEVPLDPDRIHQVLDNLIGNALKFTEEGEVTVELQDHRDKNYVRVGVKDTGPGIDPDDQDKLFQKFQQIGDVTRHSGGTGLGLSICKEIVHRHGGKIGVESRPGQGSCFWFILPIHERRKEE